MVTENDNTDKNQSKVDKEFSVDSSSSIGNIFYMVYSMSDVSPYLQSVPAHFYDYTLLKYGNNNV